MAIKGLTDRGLAFPEIGQIRKGAKKTGNKPGPDLAYFRVEFDEKEVKARKIFDEVYAAAKGQPTAIRILLPFDDISQMWDPFLEAYTAGRMVARSDGEKFLYLVDTKTGEILVKNGIDVKTGNIRPYIDGQSVGSWTNDKGKQVPIYCKPIGRLKVIIPELARAAYVTVMTSSIHDIVNLTNELNAFQTLNHGRIAGIPLVMFRKPKSISTPGPDGTRVRRVKYLIHIEVDPEWMRAAAEQLRRHALPGSEDPYQLPAGEIPEQVDLDEGELEGDAGDQGDAPLTTTEPSEEIMDGEFEHMPPMPEPPPADPVQEPMAAAPAAQAPTMQNGVQRPYDAQTLRAKLIEKANTAYRNAKPLNDDQMGLLVMCLNKCFPGKQSELRRHAIQLYLFGVESLKDAQPSLLHAALTIWFAPKKDSGGDYVPDAMAVREAQIVYNQVLTDQGQLPLPL